MMIKINVLLRHVEFEMMMTHLSGMCYKQAGMQHLNLDESVGAYD